MYSWFIQEVAECAFRHGKAYAEGEIYRSTGKFNFKCPEAIGLPDCVVQMSLEDHQFLVKLYRHSFRQGLKSPVKLTS